VLVGIEELGLVLLGKVDEGVELVGLLDEGKALLGAVDEGIEVGLEIPSTVQIIPFTENRRILLFLLSAI
jgi:hypothetical protein